MTSELQQEIERRRTLAIISHPDAGKTTLTEKLLLYGGALRLAGSVTARKKQRDTASDWMEMEKKRGISISSTVLQFDYAGFRLNLLDTPGHKDFSEDTYRVLMAVDAVIMIIDAGKGIESQTRKLFEICSKRKIPLLTFMNKLDRPALPPLALIDELEKVLGIHAFPVNWPLGMGKDFKGVYDRLSQKAHLFERVTGGAYRAPVSLHSISDPRLAELLDGAVYRHAAEELELLDVAHAGFDHGSVLEGKTTPVFFGSAANNFGVELLLKGFLANSNPPRSRKALSGIVSPDHDQFSGFIFKIQTNMDPLHRDQIAFVRVCSGKFERDMEAYHVQTGKKTRLANSHKLFGQDREIIDTAYPGDIIGVVGKGGFEVGDTLSQNLSIRYDELPRFAAECFGFLKNPNPSQHKRFRKGLDHLLREDIVQIFSFEERNKGLLLGAVGPLQFEVLQYRLQSEYGADSTLETVPWTLMRWVDPQWGPEELRAILPYDARIARDSKERIVILFTTAWSLQYFAEKHPEIEMSDTRQ